MRQERLKELFSYSENTGRLTRLVSRGPAKFGTEAGCLNHDGYRRIKIDGALYFAHRLAWLYVTGNWPEFDIDHINGLRDDNRIVNLRDVSKSTNKQNTRSHRADNSLGVLGVTKVGRSYRAVIWTDGKQRHIGCFLTPEIASAAYIAAKREQHTGNTL